MSLKGERVSSIELIRIIAIIMIIITHCLSEALVIYDKSNINYYIARFLESMSIIGVNLFIIITGYFNVTKYKVEIIKLIKLVGLSYFYSIIFFMISILLGVESLTFKNTIKYIHPFLDGGYWFIKIYVILNLLAPFLNKMISVISMRDFKILLLILIIVFSAWPSFLIHAPNNDAGYGIISFIILYLIGGYIRKYNKSNKNRFIYLFIYFVCVTITFIFNLLQPLIILDTAFMYNFLFNILSSISLFIFFNNLNIKSKTINYISTYTFAIYLIHFNPFIWRVIYKSYLIPKSDWNGKIFVINLIAGVIILFLISFSIEILRKCLFSGILKIFKFTNKNKVYISYEKYVKKINNLIFLD